MSKIGRIKDAQFGLDPLEQLESRKPSMPGNEQIMLLISFGFLGSIASMPWPAVCVPSIGATCTAESAIICGGSAPMDSVSKGRS